MRNCLTISLTYKLRYKGSKLRFEMPKIFGISLLDTKTSIRYMRFYYREVGDLHTMFLPHFFIEKDGYILNFREHNGRVIADRTAVRKPMGKKMLSEYIIMLGVDTI